MYGVDGRKFQRQYKHSISNFKEWEQKSHAEDWILYPENLSHQLSLDEVALSDGELYTVLTSKEGKGRKGSIVAIIKGTKSDTVIEYLLKINGKLRSNVRGITLDMAGSMKLRISHRWEAIEQENYLLTQAKEKKKNPEIEIFKNGDTRKQLLARSRYLLYKSREKWTSSQINELKSCSHSILI